MRKKLAGYSNQEPNPFSDSSSGVFISRIFFDRRTWSSLLSLFGRAGITFGSEIQRSGSISDGVATITIYSHASCIQLARHWCDTVDKKLQSKNWIWAFRIRCPQRIIIITTVGDCRQEVHDLCCQIPSVVMKVQSRIYTRVGDRGHCGWLLHAALHHVHVWLNCWTQSVDWSQIPVIFDRGAIGLKYLGKIELNKL